MFSGLLSPGFWGLIDSNHGVFGGHEPSVHSGYCQNAHCPTFCGPFSSGGSAYSILPLGHEKNVVKLQTPSLKIQPLCIYCASTFSALSSTFSSLCLPLAWGTAW